MSASRPVAEIVSSVPTATSGSLAAAYLAPSAWTTITDSPWATTSCISRAIRERSSRAASSTSRSAIRSACSARATSEATYLSRDWAAQPSAHAAVTIAPMVTA